MSPLFCAEEGKEYSFSLKYHNGSDQLACLRSSPLSCCEYSQCCLDFTTSPSFGGLLAEGEISAGTVALWLVDPITPGWALSRNEGASTNRTYHPRPPAPFYEDLVSGSHWWPLLPNGFCQWSWSPRRVPVRCGRVLTSSGGIPAHLLVTSLSGNVSINYCGSLMWPSNVLAGTQHHRRDLFNEWRLTEALTVTATEIICLSLKWLKMMGE